MKKRLIPLAAALLLLFPGCGLLTLHPIFTPEDLVASDHIIGNWKSGEGYIQFEPASKAATSEIPAGLKAHQHRFYLCTQRNNDGSEGARFLAFLVRIGKNHFIDLYPLAGEKAKKTDAFFSAHELKMHTVSKIEFGSNAITLLDFKEHYVDDLIRKKQVRITHTYYRRPEAAEKEKEVIITASTHELQAFLLKYGDRRDAFDAPDKSNTYQKIK